MQVFPGEYVAVIGHNGSGKSTLSKHFNGILTPQTGEVWVGGMNTKEKQRLREIRRRVGMVFQHPDNQIVATIVEDDVAFGLENIGIAAAEMKERVE
ncbi:ATP-binding cassette domain-containing protein, partial [Frankia sp. Cpl3]|nr:ATP-binding cassette domain-containing protein [Frankia sp. Cpl3]